MVWVEWQPMASSREPSVSSGGDGASRVATTARDWLVATSHGCWQGCRYKSYGPYGHWALRGGKRMRDWRTSRKTVIKLVAS